MKKLLFSLLVAFGFTTQGQQLAMFTEYMYNEVTLNPAYAGSHEVVSATLLGRTQWVGANGGPQTYSFNAHAPLRNENLGVGLSLVYDELAIESNINAMASFSYKVKFEKSDLHFGLQAGIAQSERDYSRLNVEDKNDPSAISGKSALSPNFGIGMYYFASQFYIGLSVPQLVNNQMKINGFEQSKQVRHYFLNSGYVFDFGENFKFKPTIFMKYTEGLADLLETDFTASFIIKDMFWIGGAWRTGDSFDLLLGIQATDQFKIGYAYDLTTTSLNQFNSGSHELVLNYKFSFAQGNIITPRYF